MNLIISVKLHHFDFILWFSNVRTQLKHRLLRKSERWQQLPYYCIRWWSASKRSKRIKSTRVSTLTAALALQARTKSTVFVDINRLVASLPAVLRSLLHSHSLFIISVTLHWMGLYMNLQVYQSLWRGANRQTSTRTFASTFNVIR